MLVQVIETGPDGTQTVTWDTEKLRLVGSHDTGEEILDLSLLATLLETEEVLGNESFPNANSACSYSFGYSLFDLERETDSPFEKQVTLYCE